MLLHLALYGQVWPSLVHCPRLRHLQRRRCGANHQHPLLGGLLRSPCHIWSRCRYGYGRNSGLLRRDGAQEHPRHIGIILPILLHARCHDFLLDRLCRPYAHGGLNCPVASTRRLATCPRRDPRSGYAAHDRERAVVGKAGSA